MSSKKYHISIEGEGTAEEILESIKELYKQLEIDDATKRGWNKYQSIVGTNEYYYKQDGVLRTEVNQIDE